MAIGMVKELTKIAVMEEVTEGTYVAPAAATDYVQPLDGFSMSPEKEVKERAILTSGYSAARPRVGQKSVSASLPVEMRGSGVEGGQADFHSLFKGLLGGSRTIAAQNTSKAAGNTDQILQIEDADIADYTIGDIVVVLESGAHFVSPITAIATGAGVAAITLLRTRAAGVFSNSVVISKSQTYFPSDTLSDYPTLSLSYYHGDEINERATGCRPASMSLDNFQTGELASFNFSLEGLGFDEVDEAAPQTPNFDDEVPPLILSACIYQDATQIDMNEFSFSVENSIGFITSTCSADGRISSRFSGKRAVAGKINPYKDDTSISNFENFRDNTPFSIFAFAANPSGVSGELDLGSVVGFYFPTCISTTKQVADLDGVLIEDIEFTADGGDAGESKEIFIGMI